jgi:hypothetical protein
MGVLGSIFGGVYAMTGGAKKPMISQTPPFNAKTKDEENFIQYVASHQNTHIITCTIINDVVSQTENSSSNQNQRKAPNTKCISHDEGPLHRKEMDNMTGR